MVKQSLVMLSIVMKNTSMSLGNMLSQTHFARLQYLCQMFYKTSVISWNTLKKRQTDEDVAQLPVLYGNSGVIITKKCFVCFHVEASYAFILQL